MGKLLSDYGNIKKKREDADAFAAFIGQREEEHPFAKELKRLQKISIIELANRIGVSDTTIKALRKNDYQNERPQIELVLGVCIALELQEYDSYELLRLAGHVLRNTYRDRIYRYILREPGVRTVTEWNEFLEENGESPLKFQK